MTKRTRRTLVSAWGTAERRSAAAQLVAGIREIPPNTRSLTGRMVSRRGYGIQVESKLERNAYTVLDARPDVLRITAQPDFGIRYIPDALVETAPVSFMLEVKYESELVSKWEKLLPKFEAEDEFCKEHDGLRLVFMTDHAINYLQENLIGVLHGVRSYRHAARDAEFFNSVASLLQDRSPVSVREILDSQGKTAEWKRWVRQVGGFVFSGNAFVESTPTPSFLDTRLCSLSHPPSMPFLSLDQLTRRIQTHPLRHEGGFVVAA